MKRLLFASILLCSALAVSLPHPSRQLAGEIARVDIVSGRITLRTGSLVRELAVAPHARITQNGFPADLTAVRPVFAGAPQQARLTLDAFGRVVGLAASYRVAEAAYRRIDHAPATLYIDWLDGTVGRIQVPAGLPVTLDRQQAALKDLPPGAHLCLVFGEGDSLIAIYAASVDRRGTITAVDAASGRLRLHEPDLQVPRWFTVARGARLYRLGLPATLGDIRPGDWAVCVIAPSGELRYVEVISSR